MLKERVLFAHELWHLRCHSSGVFRLPSPQHSIGASASRLFPGLIFPILNPAQHLQKPQQHIARTGHVPVPLRCVAVRARNSRRSAWSTPRYVYSQCTHNWVIILTIIDVFFVELLDPSETTILLRLNLDIHKVWNVIMPYSKKFIGGKFFCEVLFSRRF